MYILFLKFVKFSRKSTYPYGYLKWSRRINSVANSVVCESPKFLRNRKLSSLLKSGRFDDARQLFDTMPDRDEFSWNTMVGGYANSGRLVEAKRLFLQTPNPSSITWSSLISGYCQYGSEIEALELLWRMQYEGYRPSQFTLGSVLRMCAVNALISIGERIHGYAVKTRFDADVFVLTGLVDMYAKCMHISKAECLFRMMSKGKNHVTWTAMITGYSQNGDAFRAIECFRDMRTEGIEANQYTFPSVLTACAAVSAVGVGAQVHGCIARGGFGANIFVQSALVDMYAKCGDFASAWKAIETMGVDDVVSWNSMIVSCARQGCKKEVLSLFQKMHVKNMEIDDFTYPSVINSFASSKDVKNAKSLHALIIRTGFEDYRLVSNALVDMYSKQGEMSCAVEVFIRMRDKDVISWTSLVTGYAHNKFYEESLTLFCEMRRMGIDPDEIVTANILSSCAELTLLEFGQEVHATFIKSGLGSFLSVDNSLVTVYANCGCLEDAKNVFNSMQIRNVITWTALIVGYAQNGKGKESLQLYDEMITSGTEPDFITFIGLLFACSHAGLVEHGRQYFQSMSEVYGIQPGPDHYACMIDLLGRSGKMQEAKQLLDKMAVEPDATVWKALLAACRIHGDLELAEKASNTLIELDPQDAVPYIMLSNMYSAAGKWNDVARVRRLMKSKGVSKEPGCSWLKMNSKVHTFMSEDKRHPSTDVIYSKIDEVMILIKKAGYVPDMSFALHDINEECKELGLAYHSEKLAVAFGLLFVPQGAPIRIYKNLRVCGDCHIAMKFISKVYNKYIVLRDSNCFHHFKEGACSCGDYW